MHFRFLLTMVYVIGISMVLMSSFFSNAFAQDNTTTAERIFQDKSLTLPQNLKHFIILIPNEGHESQNAGDVSSDQRLINQPYLPQRAEVNRGTMVVWFNGDVDHDHKITLTNGANLENTIFDSSTFAYDESSEPIVLNDTGTFNYYQTDVNNEDEDYVMNGTITVVDEQSLDGNNNVNTGVQGNADTAGVLMVPASDVDTYTQELKNNGFAVDGTQNFNDIRAGDEQILLVWTTSGIDLENVISTLQRITQTLPYS